MINKYNVLLETERSNRKKRRKDSWYAINYKFLLIGEMDYKRLNADEVTPNYPFATHWLIGLFCWEHRFLRINAFPCSNDGSSPTISPVLIIELGCLTEDKALEKFEEIVDDVVHDRFWDN